MALGLSFGKKSQKVNSTTTSNQNEVMNQQGTTNQAQVEQGFTSSTGLTTTGTTGTTTGTQTGQTSQVATGTERQQGTTNLFSDAVIKALEAAGLGTLGSTVGAGSIDRSGLDFDSDQFIEDAVTRATAAAGIARQQGQNSLYDSIGGTAKGNTMAALLDQQLANQELAAISGDRNTATATAAGIAQGNIGAEVAARGSEQGLMQTILGLLKGGQQTTDSVQSQQQQTDGTSQQASSQQQTQDTTQATQQMSQTVNSLVSLIEQLVSGTKQTTGTETTKGTTKGSGGGFSLSI